MVPDGSKPYLPDYQPYVVNMAAVYVRRVEHGFGVLKSAPGPELPFEGPFRYYHGQFHAGQIHGRGVEYTDTTVFSGLYRKGMRWGKGRMDYCLRAMKPTATGSGDQPAEVDIARGQRL